MQIEFRVQGTVIAIGVLEENATARDFVALLPVSVRLVDYEGTEKIANLPRALTTAGAPQTSTPVAGDISFYAPWGNLAIFYRDGMESTGLVRLGRLATGAHALQHPGPLDTTITLAHPPHA